MLSAFTEIQGCEEFGQATLATNTLSSKENFAPTPSHLIEIQQLKSPTGRRPLILIKDTESVSYVAGTVLGWCLEGIWYSNTSYHF